MRLHPELDGAPVPFNFGACAASWVCCLLDELRLDPVHMASDECLLDAWKENRLCGVQILQTDAMRNASPSRLSFFMANSSTGYGEHVLPCFVVFARPGGDVEPENVIELFWVAPRARRRGVGACLDRMYACEYVHLPVVTAVPFWTKLGFCQECDSPTEPPPDQRKRMRGAEHCATALALLA